MPSGPKSSVSTCCSCLGGQEGRASWPGYMVLTSLKCLFSERRQRLAAWQAPVSKYPARIQAAVSVQGSRKLGTYRWCCRMAWPSLLDAGRSFSLPFRVLKPSLYISPRSCLGTVELGGVTHAPQFYRFTVFSQYRLDIKKIFLARRKVKQWSRLPREADQPSSVEDFKTRLDKAVSSLVWPPSWACFLSRRVH